MFYIFQIDLIFTKGLAKNTLSMFIYCIYRFMLIAICCWIYNKLKYEKNETFSFASLTYNFSKHMLFLELGFMLYVQKLNIYFSHS